jgi:hypothetical protein
MDLKLSELGAYLLTHNLPYKLNLSDSGNSITSLDFLGYFELRIIEGLLQL